jgi:hypothetical protein
MEVTITSSIVSQHFMEHEGSSPLSQELSTCLYPEPDRSSPNHPILSLQEITMRIIMIRGKNTMVMNN